MHRPTPSKWREEEGVGEGEGKAVSGCIVHMVIPFLILFGFK